MGSKNKELIEVLDLLLAGLGVAVEAQKDGKIGLEDAGLLLKIIPSIGPAFENIGAVPAELAHLSSEDAQELVTHVMAKLSLGNAHAVAVINASFKLAVAGLGLLEAIKAVPAPAAAAESPSA